MVIVWSGTFSLPPSGSRNSQLVPERPRLLTPPAQDIFSVKDPSGEKVHRVPGEIKRREVVELDPQVSPEEIMSR